MGLQNAGHDWATNENIMKHTITRISIPILQTVLQMGKFNRCCCSLDMHTKQLLYIEPWLDSNRWDRWKEWFSFLTEESNSPLIKQERELPKSEREGSYGKGRLISQMPIPWSLEMFLDNLCLLSLQIKSGQCIVFLPWGSLWFKQQWGMENHIQKFILSLSN